MVEHNSVIRPVNHKVRDGAEATFVKPDPEGYIDPQDLNLLEIVDDPAEVVAKIERWYRAKARSREKRAPLIAPS